MRQKARTSRECSEGMDQARAPMLAPRLCSRHMGPAPAGTEGHQTCCRARASLKASIGDFCPCTMLRSGFADGEPCDKMPKRQLDSWLLGKPRLSTATSHADARHHGPRRKQSHGVVRSYAHAQHSGSTHMPGSCGRAWSERAAAVESQAAQRGRTLQQRRQQAGRPDMPAWRGVLAAESTGAHQLEAGGLCACQRLGLFITINPTPWYLDASARMRAHANRILIGRHITCRV